MKKFYLDIQDFNSNIDDALKQALKYAMAASQSAKIHRIVIIVPSNSVAKTVGGILLSFGCRVNSGTYTVIGYSTNIVINSTSNYSHFDTDAVIYFAINSEEIFKIEERRTFELEIAIKGYGDIELWKGTWDAINPQSQAHNKLEPNNKVKHALDQMSNAVNITQYAVFHPSDEEFAKKIVRTLHAMENPNVIPEDVFAYLKREKNWPFGLCKIVCEWFSKLNAGGTFKGGKISKTEKKVMYANW